MSSSGYKRKHALILIICVAVLTAAAVIMFAPVLVKPFRLHILANSDSAADQQVKLIVRDAVLKATAEGIKKCENAAQAEEYIRDNIGIILETADNRLAEKGFKYKASATVGVFSFPERSYGNVTYPEGDYEAVRVILGEGEGQNWWCVIFPPLCLSSEANRADAQYTSFFVELWEIIFGVPSIQ